MPLDFESRYLGKEVIGVFGNRLGKSGMSFLLSLITSMFGNLGLQGLSCLSTGASMLWLIYAFRLSSAIPLTKLSIDSSQEDKIVMNKKVK
jgi:ATP/ADP translocase